MIYLEDFYLMAFDYVKNYPKTDYKEMRPQTFAVLDEFSDLNVDSLNKTVSDRNLPYLFSRSWNKNEHNSSGVTHDLPMLVFFLKNTMVGSLVQVGTKHTHTLEVVFLEHYNKECADNKKGNPYNQRVRNEIYKSSKYHLLNFFSYVSQVKYYKSSDDSIRSGLYHPSHADEIDALVMDQEMTTRFGRCLDSDNLLTPWDGGIRDLHGTVVEIKITLPECRGFEYNSEEIGLVVKGDVGC